MEESDLALFERWSAGDLSAGNKLFKRHYPAIYRFLENKIDDGLEDLVQQTFLACVRGRASFRRESSFRTYLFSIAKHNLYQYWRTRSVQRASVSFDEISVASLSTSLRGRAARREDFALLLGALRELPLEQQILLELHYWEGLGHEELAEVLEIAEPTTRSRLFRARQALRDRLARLRAPPAGSDADFDAWARALCPDAQAPERDRGDTH